FEIDLVRDEGRPERSAGRRKAEHKANRRCTDVRTGREQRVWPDVYALLHRAAGVVVHRVDQRRDVETATRRRGRRRTQSRTLRTRSRTGDHYDLNARL